MQLLIDIPAIMDEDDQEDAKDAVDDSSDPFWIEHPHEQERWHVEEKQLQDEKDKALPRLIFHVLDCLMHWFSSFVASEGQTWTKHATLQKLIRGIFILTKADIVMQSNPNAIPQVVVLTYPKATSPGTSEPMERDSPP